MAAVKDFVSNGGKYLGFCMGADFAGSDPGMGLLEPGNTDGYIGSPGASVNNDADSTVPVAWRGQHRIHFFQDGAYIIPSKMAGERIIAYYDNGLVDALTKPYGKGRVGVVGSHPEAENRNGHYKSMGISTGGRLSSLASFSSSSTILVRNARADASPKRLRNAAKKARP
jgi:glutamine amidotransferase-like uncharacterized protein